MPDVWDHTTKRCNWLQQFCLMNITLIMLQDLPSVLWLCWLGSRKGIQPIKTQWWGAGMVISLRQGADMHMAQLTPLPLTISCSCKSWLVLPFWYRLTQIVSDEGLLNKCCCCNAARCSKNHLAHFILLQGINTCKICAVRSIFYSIAKFIWHVDGFRNK